MQVNIEHVEKKQGLVFKKVLHGVKLAITFSEEEKAIIKQRKLEGDVILERAVSADKNADKENDRGIAASIAKAAISGRDSLTPNLTIRKLLAGPDVHYFDTPLEAKTYEEALRETLPQFKAYVTENAGIEEKSSSFEL